MAQIVQPDRRQTQPAYSIGETMGEPLRVQHRAVVSVVIEGSRRGAVS